MDKNLPQAVPGTEEATATTEQTGSSRREFLGQSGRVAAGVGVAALLGNLGNYALSYAAGGPPIKIGILHSLSGTMAISEVSLRDVVLMAVEEINKAGGVMGRQVEAKVVDPASNWDL
ncbi:MAG TPA: transporter substrate-binding protein, partial [Nitrospira sp.]|nr:transporter substrate-binding protein [Nitrospira sp.]